MACALVRAKKRCPVQSLTKPWFFVTFLKRDYGFLVRILLVSFLQRFNLQIHHLTPNAFAWLGMYAMALKMSGCALSVNTFVRYYETHLHKKVVVYTKL